MNKTVIYTSLLFLLIGCITFLGFYSWYGVNIILEKDGLQFTKIEKADVALPHGEQIVFIYEDQNLQEKQIYKFNGYGRSAEMNYLVFKTQNVEKSNDDLFVEAINGRIEFTDTLKKVTTDDMVDLLKKMPRIEARQLVMHWGEEDLFSFIDVTPIIFIFIGVLFFILFLISDGLLFSIQKVIKNSLVKTGVQLFLLSVIVFFISHVRMVHWFPTSFESNLWRNIMVVFPTYFLFQFLNKRYFEKMENTVGEFYKFFSLIVIAVGFFLMSNQIIHQLDYSQYETVLIKNLNCPSGRLPLGYVFSFTVGNLLNNVRKHVFSSN